MGLFMIFSNFLKIGLVILATRKVDILLECYLIFGIIFLQLTFDVFPNRLFVLSHRVCVVPSTPEAPASILVL